MAVESKFLNPATGGTVDSRLTRNSPTVPSPTAGRGILNPASGRTIDSRLATNPRTLPTKETIQQYYEDHPGSRGTVPAVGTRK